MDSVKTSKEDNLKINLREIVIIMKIYIGSEQIQRARGMVHGASAMQRISSLKKPPSAFMQPNIMQILLLLML
jgi:hypothetical protein